MHPHTHNSICSANVITLQSLNMSTQENQPAPQDRESANESTTTGSEDVVEPATQAPSIDNDVDDASNVEIAGEDDISAGEAMCIPYDRHVASLELHANKNRRAIRFTKDPKLMKHVRLAAYPGVQIYEGFDDMALLPQDQHGPVRVVSPGKCAITYLAHTFCKNTYALLCVQACSGISTSQAAQKQCVACAASNFGLRQSVSCLWKRWSCARLCQKVNARPCSILSRFRS